MAFHSLTTMPLEERHTAANIAEWFDILLEKVKTVVHDNSADTVEGFGRKA